ncbi:MAPEG family protein [Kangiella sp. TOML190]|uniref:MAPEG family protein n=1 Tax=Kangiella sp. TOML190 TaxID=2931351 RepID=UPI00203A4D10|nr:MAPEG family protein [Kangiella sp. TOML190]
MTVLYPLLAMVALTIVVACLMYFRRINYMKSHRIHPQKVANREQAKELLKDNRASDNYLNLFEMPVLFYVAGFVILFANQGTKLLIALLWAYVAFRVAHSLIHCTYNIVMHRFGAFMLSAITLLAIWLILIVQILFGISL